MSGAGAGKKATVRGFVGPHTKGLDETAPAANDRAATPKSLPCERRDMADSSVTLLEIHLGDGDIEIGPFDLFGASDESAADVDSEAAADAEAEADTDATGGESDGGCRARSVAGLLLALAALAVVAVGVAKLRGDDEVPPGIAGDE